MAVKVIKKGPAKSVVKEIVCKNCGATLQYVPADIIEETRTDYGGGSDTYRFIKCPECLECVYVKW